MMKFNRLNQTDSAIDRHEDVQLVLELVNLVESVIATRP